jgi:hypothetical protein
VLTHCGFPLSARHFLVADPNVKGGRKQHRQGTNRDAGEPGDLAAHPRAPDVLTSSYRRPSSTAQEWARLQWRTTAARPLHLADNLHRGARHFIRRPSFRRGTSRRNDDGYPSSSCGSNIGVTGRDRRAKMETAGGRLAKAWRSWGSAVRCRGLSRKCAYRCDDIGRRWPSVLLPLP